MPSAVSSLVLANSATFVRDFTSRPPKAASSRTFRQATLFREVFSTPKLVIRARLSLIHAHRAERVHEPWLKPRRVKHQAAWNRSTGRAGVRGGARAGRSRCVRIFVWLGESVFFGFLLTALAQNYECE